MSSEVVDALCGFIKDFVPSDNSSLLQVYLIGGEPLLVDLEWYTKFFAKLDQTNRNITAKLQTSLLHLETPHVEFIQTRLGNQVYTSFDPFSRSLDGSTSAYLTQWFQKVRFAAKAKIHVCAQMTVTPEIIDCDLEALFTFLILPDLPKISFCHYTESRTGQPYVTNLQYSELMIRIFERTLFRFHQHLPVPKIRTFVDAINSVHFERPYGAWNTSLCSTGHSCAILPDGTVTACLLYPKPLGTIFEAPRTLFSSENSTNCQRSLQLRRIQCRACPYSVWCSHRCYRNSTPSTTLESECQRYKTFLDYVQLQLETRTELLFKYSNFASGD